MNTAPYLDRAPLDLARQIGHQWEVQYHQSGDWAEGEVVSASLIFDESWSPHVQLQMTCRLPDDPTLALLDPRTGARIGIRAGYVYPDGRGSDAEFDIHDLVNLRITRREVRRPQNDLILTAMSEEYQAQRVPWYAAAVPNPGSTVRTEDALAQLINGVYQAGGGWFGGYQSTIGTENGVGEDWTPANWLPDTPVGTQTMWSLMAAVADAHDVWLYHDGIRDWQMRPRPRTAAPIAAAQLRVGPTGNLTETSSETSTESGWANAVHLIHQWTDNNGNPHRLATRAAIADGPMSVSVAGYHGVTVTRSTPTNQVNIRASAAALVRRAVTRGRGYRLTAPAMYWLRPGDTVTVELPTGGQERHLVVSVRFEYPQGLMHVSTRLPESVTITGAD